MILCNAVVIFMIVQLTRAGHQGFIPEAFNATTFDITVIKSLGVMNFMAVSFSLVGGLSESHNHALTFIEGKAVNKHRGSCLILYLKYGFFWPFICAVSQNHQLPVKIAFLTIHLPIIPIFNGLVQLGWALCALRRYFDMRSAMQTQRRFRNANPETVVFQSMMWDVTSITWFVTISGRITLQSGEGTTYAAAMAGS